MSDKRHTKYYFLLVKHIWNALKGEDVKYRQQPFCRLVLTWWLLQQRLQPPASASQQGVYKAASMVCPLYWKHEPASLLLRHELVTSGNQQCLLLRLRSCSAVILRSGPTSQVHKCERLPCTDGVNGNTFSSAALAKPFLAPHFTP